MDRFSYADHSDLLSQVATSEEEARAVRRILGPELQRELRYLRDFDRDPNPEPWPHCCGACGQGRKVCATPEACRQPETQTWFNSIQEDALAVWFGMRNAAIYLAIASLAVWWMYELADVLWGWL